MANSGSFLQSWEWGEFQERAGRRVFRFLGKSVLSEAEGRVEGSGWQAQFVEITVPVIGKKYWYCPRGPVMNQSIKGGEFQKILAEIIEEIKKDNPNIIFFRLGPEWLVGQGIEKILDKAGFKKLHYDIEPSQTQILDIVKSEEELLAQMHEKWRYNIRLAERKGVKIKMMSVNDPEFEKYFKAFYELIDKGTAERKGIRHHSKEYYRGQLEIGNFVLFVAEYEEKFIAANIVVFWGNRATYLHGATDNNFRNVMAPHLLQWEQIKEAKKRSCDEYDFWGIVNESTIDKRGASWEGFTRFKKGFGGREENYIGYFDYPLNKFWYFAYKLAQKIRR